jgi:PhzF family phenazine biosynthesis protein
METRQGLVVDACAVEPTGGMPVGVLSGADLTDEQARAVADELAADVALPGDLLRVVGPNGERDHHPHATIAAVAAEHERGDRDAGTDTVQTTDGERSIEVTSDGGVWLNWPTPTAETVDVGYDALAAALGVDVAALQDVGADLPPMVVSAGVDALAVPVNFLEHLSGAAPDRALLADVLATADADAVFAFTFDTLGDAAAHARAFTTGEAWTRTNGLEVPVTPAVAGGVVARLFAEGVVEDARTSVEQGHFCDRPGRVHIEAGDSLRLGGHTFTSLDGTLTVPPAEDDDIIEA